ncbi:MAG: PAS domain S-box protein [Cyanobacteria bacterium]|nr:PAS domain S-box protein [Cyanobacteriota bacterium]
MGPLAYSGAELTMKDNLDPYPLPHATDGMLPDDPAALARRVRELEQRVRDLETQKAALLQEQTEALERQVTERTALLQDKVARAQLIANISAQIRSSLELSHILEATVRESRSLLGCDRLLFYQFHGDWSGTVVAEDVGEGWTSCLFHRLEDQCFRSKAPKLYGKGHILAVADVYEAGYTDCHLEVLERYQVKSNLVVPLRVGDRIWGLLIGHHCARATPWRSTDLQLLDEIAGQLAIALQQAIAYRQLQQELKRRRQTEASLKDSEKRYATLAEAAPVGIFRTDLEGNCLYVNERWCELSGLSPERARWMGWIDAIYPDDRGAVLTSWHTATQHQLPFELEYRLQRPNGEVCWVLGRAVAESSPDGVQVGYVSTITDITDRKRTEEALQSSEARLKEAQGLARIGSWELDLKTNTLVGSDEFYRLLGCDRGQFPATYEGFLERLHPDDRAIVHQRYVDSLRHCTAYEVLHRVQGADGTLHHLLHRGRTQCDAHGRPLRSLGTLQDVTERIQTEAALKRLNTELELRVEWRTAQLRDREAQLQDLFDSANDLIQSVSLATGRFDYVNRAWCAALGYDAVAVETLTLAEVLHPDDQACYREAIAHLQQPHTTSIGVLEMRLLTRTGEVVLVEGSLNCRRQGDRPVSIRAILRDITERKRVEAALRDSEAKLQAVLAHAPVPIYLKDLQGRYLLTSAAFPAQDCIGKTDGEIFPAAIADLFQSNDRATLAQGHAQEYQEQLTDPATGQVHTFLSLKFPLLNGEGQPYALGGISTDITERIRAEAVLQEQLAAIESVVDGIAILKGGVYTYANRAHCKLFGYDRPEELLGQSWRILYGPEELARFDTEVIPHLTRSRTWAGETVARRRDGQTFNEGLSLTLMADDTLICVCRDISDRKRAETQLRELSDRLALALKSGSVGCWDWDIRHNLLTWDDRMYELYGLEAREDRTAYDTWQERVHPDDRPATVALLKQAVQGQGEFDTEFRICRPDGHIRYIKAHGMVQRNADGTPQRVIGINFDISDRKATERRLQQQANQEGLLRSISQRIRATLDLDDILNTTVAEVHRILRVDRTLICRLHGDGQREVIAEAVSPPWPSLHRALFPGTLFPTALQLLYQQEPYFCIDDVRQDAVLPELGHLLDTLSVRAAVIAPIPGHSHPWGLLVVNQCSGPRPWQDWEGKLLQHLAESLAIAIQQSDLFQKLQTELGVRQQAEAQLRENNQQLAIYNQELARATRLKDEFLANMSHELRTPLNAILGMAEGLQEFTFGPLTERQTKALGTIERSGRHLLDLINDILDLSKIEAGKLELHSVLMGVRDLCHGSLIFVQQLALKKRITLTLEMPKELHQLQFYGDDLRLRQVLINLLNNAVKFTPEGGSITMTVTLEAIAPPPLNPCPEQPGAIAEATDESMAGAIAESPAEFSPTQEMGPVEATSCLIAQHQVCFAIRDTGIGIAPEDLSKLFQSFVQIDSKLNRQYAGTGLGLALVKRIVDLHGGSVAVTSQPSMGSCFTVRIPIVGSPSLRRAAAAIAAGDGSAPEPTGSTAPLEATALPGSADPNPAVAQLAPTAPSEGGAAIAPRILIVEDNPANIETVSGYLESHGFELLLADNGKDAIAIAQDERPDLILMDIQMPGMDGLEAIQRIRQIGPCATIPIIALTALAMAGDRQRCLDAGANEYLTKPVQLRGLVNAIKGLLSP